MNIIGYRVRHTCAVLEGRIEGVVRFVSHSSLPYDQFWFLVEHDDGAFSCWPHDFVQHVERIP